MEITNLKITFDSTWFECLGWIPLAFSVLIPLTKIAIMSYHVILGFFELATSTTS